MRLENLNLINFKNFEEIDIGLDGEVVFFVGDNGTGKTNLLDAIHYLSMTKSAFNATDQQSIKHDELFYMIKGTFLKNSKKIIVQCSLKNGQKKSVSVDKNPYEKISDHIGEFPVVLVAPDDTDIIKEGSEPRRKFFDSLISQVDKAYMQDLMRYNHVMRQRNSLLKNFSEKAYVDHDLLEPYDREILHVGEKIFDKRQQFTEHFVPVHQKNYRQLSDDREKVNLQYESELQKHNFRKIFKDNLKRDILLQRTCSGVHRDDFIFTIDNYPVKKFGSQGQQKSFLIGLKLAQFEIMRNIKQYKPLLLLDDIFDKLDEKRINKLMEMMVGGYFGQIFITDARPERTLQLSAKLNGNFKIYQLNKEKPPIEIVN